ncbi:hypothetical protein JVU11DRAFT_2649 [Chiua virens]|nr:hypothetical protein JVU11DRAFT_2649 [Chiua virens]
MYLFAFNVVSALGWVVVLAATVSGVVLSDFPARFTAENAFSTKLAVLLLRYVPPTWDVSWSVLAPVQSLAAFEVLHVLLGLRFPATPTTPLVSSVCNPPLGSRGSATPPFMSSTLLAPAVRLCSPSAPVSEWHNGRYLNWSLEDYLKAAMVLIWIPGLYVMYTHMIRTRRKAFGAPKPQKLSAKPKDRIKAN